MTKEFVEKMQINRGLQFPMHDGNFSGFTSNINNRNPNNNETNMMNGRGFGGFDNDIRPSNDVRLANNYVPHFQSKNENLTSQVSNANLISSSNKYNNNVNDKRINTPAIKLPKISEIVNSVIDNKKKSIFKTANLTDHDKKFVSLVNLEDDDLLQSQNIKTVINEVNSKENDEEHEEIILNEIDTSNGFEAKFIDSVLD